MIRLHLRLPKEMCPAVVEVVLALVSFVFVCWENFTCVLFLLGTGQAPSQSQAQYECIACISWPFETIVNVDTLCVE